MTREEAIVYEIQKKVELQQKEIENLRVEVEKLKTDGSRKIASSKNKDN